MILKKSPHMNSAAAISNRGRGVHMRASGDNETYFKSLGSYTH